MCYKIKFWWQLISASSIYTQIYSIKLSFLFVHCGRLAMPYLFLYFRFQWKTFSTWGSCDCVCYLYAANKNGLKEGTKLKKSKTRIARMPRDSCRLQVYQIRQPCAQLYTFLCIVQMRMHTKCAIFQLTKCVLVHFVYEFKSVLVGQTFCFETENIFAGLLLLNSECARTRQNKRQENE